MAPTILQPVMSAGQRTEWVILIGMFDAYTIVKIIHVLAAITAVGSNLTYGLWIARARKEQAAQLFALKGVKLLDDRVANPAYAVLLVTGLINVHARWSFTTLWVLAAIIMYGVVAVLGVAVLTPGLKRQIQLLESNQADSPEFRRLSKRASMIGPFLVVVVISIIVLMVAKPS